MTAHPVRNRQDRVGPHAEAKGIRNQIAKTAVSATILAEFEEIEPFLAHFGLCEGVPSAVVGFSPSWVGWLWLKG